MKQIILMLTLAVFSLVESSAQALLYSTAQREGLYGQSGKTEFSSLTPGSGNTYIAVGQASRGPNGGSDVYWAKLDRKGRAIAQRYLGRNKSDGAYAIRPRPNGGFLVAGFSEQPGQSAASSRYAGSTDGWLLWLDDHGKAQSELLLGSPGQDAFTDILPLLDGGWIAVGHSEGQAWAVRIAANRSVRWQKRWSHPEGNAFIRAAAQAGNRIYLTGRIGKAGHSECWLLGINQEGDRLLDRTFKADIMSEGHAITALDDQSLAIAGEAYTRSNRLQGSWLRLNDRGEQQALHQFGGRENDRFMAAAQAADGHWVLLGESHSYARGARQPKAWAVQLSETDSLLAEGYYGSKAYDSGRALIQRTNGRWLMAGQSGQKLLSSGQAWIWTASGSSAQPSFPVTATFDPVVYANDNQIAGHGDTGAFLPIRLQGKQPGRRKDLRAEITHLASGETWERELLAGGSSEPYWRGCPIPIPAQGTLGEEQYEVQLYAGEQPAGPPHQMSVVFDNRPSSQLRLEATAVLGSFAPGRIGEVHFTMTNTGSTLIDGLQLKGSGTPCLPVSNSNVNIGQLPPGSSLDYTARLPVKDCAPGTIQSLSFELADGSLTHRAKKQLAIEVAAQPSATTTSPLITWLSPNPDQFDYLELVWNEPSIQVQVKVIANDTIHKKQFCLSINGQPCNTGSKFDEVQMSGRGPSRTFTQTVVLEEGENVLQAQLVHDSGTVQTTPMKVLYNARQANLHLLSIGVPSYDLAYTVEDARDFAQLFSNQSPLSPAFQHVFIDTLTGEDRTTKTAILKSLRRIQYRYSNQQIRPGDLLVLFISSHGLSTEDGRFRIAASDYDSPFREETSLDFETEILDYLKTLPCRKLIFIDACHSGAAGQGLPDEFRSASALASMAKRAQHTSLLLSCQADEYSYEDQRWRNGAFTEALVQVAQTFRQHPEQVDQNADGKLSLQEWYAELTQTTAELVAQKRPRPKSGQHPVLHLSNLNSDLILLQVNP